MSDIYSLYLVRHAIAAERGDKYPDDSKRPLTPHGIAKFTKVARGLAAIEAEVGLILTSPLTRARQTAEILAECLPGRTPIVETTVLAPGASYQDLVAELGNHPRASSIALVGHEPGIGEVAARLIGYKGTLEFRKGAVCRIDVDTLPPAAPGRLRWFAAPKLLAGVK
jgi:phosphohistidine phosphatase